MDQAHAKPDCLFMAKDEKRLYELTENNRLLDEVQKGLAAYLEVKRIAFPRYAEIRAAGGML